MHSIGKSAVKCFSTEDDFEKAVATVIKEYCLLKIASILRVGPRLPKLFGFDIVVFEKCIEFSMECCYEVTQI